MYCRLECGRVGNARWVHVRVCDSYVRTLETSQGGGHLTSTLTCKLLAEATRSGTAGSPVVGQRELDEGASNPGLLASRAFLSFLLLLNLLTRESSNPPNPGISNKQGLLPPRSCK